jgi:hypothetical protein
MYYFKRRNRTRGDVTSIIQYLPRMTVPTKRLRVTLVKVVNLWNTTNGSQCSSELLQSSTHAHARTTHTHSAVVKTGLYGRAGLGGSRRPAFSPRPSPQRTDGSKREFCITTRSAISCYLQATLNVTFFIIVRFHTFGSGNSTSVSHSRIRFCISARSFNILLITAG